jgi:hypothetical protein
MIEPRKKTQISWSALRRVGRFLRVVWCAAPLLAAPAGAERIRLAPQLHAGQVMFYQLEFTASRTTTIESPYATPPLPPGGNVSAACLLQVHVDRVDASGIRLKTYLSEKTAASPNASGPAPDLLIEVLVASDGTASEIKGLDQLTAAQQFAWTGWLARFTSSWSYPRAGIHRGEKWQGSEPETTPTPLAKLVWLKKYEYVRDEPCGAPAASGANLCAVILVRAHIYQKSPPDEATPEDYKSRHLVTRGTTNGSNETILYISRATGLLVRATERAAQSMDATIALADGSNQVRYLMDAKSRSLIQLVPDAPKDVR